MKVYLILFKFHGGQLLFRYFLSNTLAMGEFTVPARKLLALELVFLIPASTAVALRFMASRIRKRSVQLHDVFCVLSWVGLVLLFYDNLLITPEVRLSGIRN